MSDYTPPGHELITINLHRCTGHPCLKGSRLWASMIAARFREAGYQGVREWWDYGTGFLTDELIDAAVAWESDPEHKRIERLALRRQKYAERRAG